MGFVVNTDFSNIEPNEGANGSFFPVSDSSGWLCELIASDGRENSAKNGQILVCQLRGLDGPVQGKLHDFTINLSNPNQQAVNIGMGEMSAIAHVTGHIKVGNTQEWHHKPFRVVITPELDKEKQPTGRNRISKFLDRNGNGPKEAGKGAMTGGQGGGFGGNQQQNNGGGFQQNNSQQGGGFQQQGNQQGGGFGNQGQTQQASNGGNGGGFGNNNQQGGTQQFSNGQTADPNAQGGAPNPGSQFQPNNGGGGFQQGNQQGFDPNAANQQGGNFQQNGGGQQQGNMGGWNRQ